MKTLNGLNTFLFGLNATLLGLNTILFSFIATTYEDNMRVAFGAVAVLSAIVFLITIARLRALKRSKQAA